MKLVLEFKASKSPMVGPENCQRHEDDPSVWRLGDMSPSKTKLHNQTANTKCRTVDLYEEICRHEKTGEILHISKIRRPQMSGPVYPSRHANKLLG